jgi:hypothetical protein
MHSTAAALLLLLLVVLLVLVLLPEGVAYAARRLVLDRCC